MFHLSVVVLLIGVTVNTLLQFRGDVVVVSGQGFSDNLTQYDDVTAGAWFSEASLPPFTVTVDRFDAAFETAPSNAARHGCSGPPCRSATNQTIHHDLSPSR